MFRFCPDDGRLALYDISQTLFYLH